MSGLDRVDYACDLTVLRAEYGRYRMPQDLRIDRTLEFEALPRQKELVHEEALVGSQHLGEGVRLRIDAVLPAHGVEEHERHPLCAVLVTDEGRTVVDVDHAHVADLLHIVSVFVEIVQIQRVVYEGEVRQTLLHHTDVVDVVGDHQLHVGHLEGREDRGHEVLRDRAAAYGEPPIVGTPGLAGGERLHYLRTLVGKDCARCIGFGDRYPCGGSLFLDRKDWQRNALLFVANFFFIFSIFYGLITLFKVFAG